ncbi:MAG: hypothetical protein ABSC92_04570, partial [Rhizomicrobium sp.]
MAEETEDRVSGAADSGVNPAAMSVALGAAAQNDRVASKAETFLEKQSALSDEQIKLTAKQSLMTDLQIEDLKREDRLKHWSLRVHHVSAVMKVSFEIAVAL